MKYVIGLAVLLLQACTNTTQLAQDALQRDLYSRAEIHYRNIEKYPGSVLCGQYNTDYKVRERNYRRFIYRGTAIDSRPSRDDWAIFCSNDQAQSLYTLLGIDMRAEPSDSFSAIRNDYLSLSQSLQQYLLDSSLLPSTKDGLQGLLKPGEGYPQPELFRAGGYIDAVPKDPWGADYLYTGPGLVGVAPTFEIRTLGADGKEGGDDENADISTQHLKYIEHIQQL